jgi:hypothetical protein
MRHAILTVFVLSTMTVRATAQQTSTADRDAVRRAALDYLEGFYEGDSAKIVGKWMIVNVMWQTPPR